MSQLLEHMLDSWSKEEPTEPGYYWYYGYQFKSERINPERFPSLYVMKVRRISDGLAFICEGHFFSLSEGGVGLWLKIETPAMPEDMDAIVEELADSELP